MKKAFALLVIGLVLITAVCAATSTKYTKYGNIFKSGEFTLKGTSYSLGSNGTKTGTGSPLTVSMHAGQYYMDATTNGESMRVLIQNGVCNIISDSEKSIMTMPTDETDDMINFPAAYDVFSSGRANLDGKTYNFEKAKEDDGALTTYWYNGNDLFAIQSADTIVYVDSISQKADASLFVLPSGYQVMDLSSLFGDWGSSDSYSGYDYGSYDYDASDYDWSSTMSDIDWMYSVTCSRAASSVRHAYPLSFSHWK